MLQELRTIDVERESLTGSHSIGKRMRETKTRIWHTDIVQQKGIVWRGEAKKTREMEIGCRGLHLAVDKKKNS